MQGDPEVLRLLNEQLTSELTAINQYFLHAKMQENWGFTELAKHTRAESFDEMVHAERITDRILLLDGLPIDGACNHGMDPATSYLALEGVDRLRRASRDESCDIDSCQNRAGGRHPNRCQRERSPGVPGGEQHAGRCGRHHHRHPPAEPVAPSSHSAAPPRSGSSRTDSLVLAPFAGRDYASHGEPVNHDDRSNSDRLVGR